ncbi:MAG: purine-nucleoside phosphorylase [Chloroflexota bacterium]|nr:MAG: purine-nucleoside phosphorylase [Chloroflexota bacterium]
MTFTRKDFAAAARVIRERTSLEPRIGLVLGSGLGHLADTLVDADVVPYRDIPGWPQSTVEGHRGELVLGMLEGQPVVVQRGRAHFYEGYTPQQVTFPVRVMRELGVTTLILTNAAGGLNPDFHVGDVMLINDHINFVGMAGNNPLMGPNDPELGQRFIGMSQTYDRKLRQEAHRAASEAGITLREGVYVCLSGPTFETPAEVRMLRMLGGDAVGMSTVHEVLVARHGGMRVLAFSGITNLAIDRLDAGADANHEEVLEAGRLIVPRLEAILRGVLRNMAE